ncbi:unnamed protein product [Adineta ricciae]|uniref:Uncharacterized protein n=1 Tax=Adineta ricciae TaxID=249248 RepID=A0A815IWW0_ADIRI|nr:unnamed protein product [Adineta ricciae]CAF1374465.1 unnamed protein product [Adineta ricciae]
MNNINISHSQLLFKIIFIVILLICLLIGIVIFSIYYIREDLTKNILINNNLTTKINSISITSSNIVRLSCQLKVKRQLINIQCLFSNTSLYEIVDLNNDKRVDFIFYCHDKSTINVLIANSNGSFGEIISTYVNGSVYKIYVADINNDDRLDLILLTQILFYNNINIFFGNGNGTFQIQNIVSLNLIYSPIDISIVDLNKDNNLDIICIVQYDNVVRISYGYGNGTFSLESILFIGLTSDPQQLAIGDFDNNDYLDIAVLNGRSLHIHVFFANTNGSFQLPKWFYTAYDVAQLRMIVDDFDNDYQSDIVYLHSWENYTVSMLYQYNNGTFHIHQQILMETSVLLDSKSVIIRDLNNDNYLDIIIGSLSSDKIYGLLGDGTGYFETQTIYFNTLNTSSNDIINSSSCDNIIINMNLVNNILSVLFNPCQC